MAGPESPSQGAAAQVEATLGNIGVVVSQFRCSEKLSQLFRAQIEFQSAEDFSVNDLVSQTASIIVHSQVSNSDPVRVRRFFGTIRRFSYLGELDAPGRPDGRVSRYRAEIVPWVWYLTQRTNSRIFQNKTVPEILEVIFAEYGGQCQQRFRSEYPSLDYCVQYRESDFAFVSRLMEENGIYYYFNHLESATELVIADNLGGYFECAEPALRFGNMGTGSTGDHVQHWEHDYDFRPGSYVHDDFNFEHPADSLLSSQASILKLSKSNGVSLYDYPGRFGSTTEGRTLAQLRIEEQEASQELIYVKSVTPVAAPGAKFSLLKHPNPRQSQGEFCITAVEHEFSGGGDGVRSADLTLYRNKFTCIPATRTFRPERMTPMPFVRGLQSAIVTGAEGDLVYTDSYGRVKVQFRWDREGEKNENSSCWIRVSQGWAGGEYGNSYLPHVGQEVLVSFLEGDPDRPVITGRVYNADNMPPETLPDNKLRAIVAKDQVGNIIALDADAKRVDIQNAEDKFELTVGESVTAAAGMDVGITLGCGVGINLGASTSAGLAAAFDVSLGFASSVFLGGAYDASFGGSFSYAKGNFVNAGDSVGQIAFKQAAEFVSHESVALAGGSGANNSVVLASSDSLIVSYGMTDPKFAGCPALALGLGVFGAAILGTIGIAASGAAAFLAGKAKEKGDFDDYAKGAVGCGVASLVSTGIAGFLLTKFAKTWSQVKQPVHGGSLPPTAQLILDANGAKLQGKKETALIAGLGGGNGIVKVVANDFNVDAAKMTTAGDLDVKGVFSSANIRDIGQPAAAAAAKAKAAAEIARNAAIISIKAAKHAAKQATQTAKVMSK
jgi:type VI secretion system secreted protein VgrG